jgi:hypothetical protein
VGESVSLHPTNIGSVGVRFAVAIQKSRSPSLRLQWIVGGGPSKSSSVTMQP